MANRFWFKMEWAKWRHDPALRRCSKETRGFWVDCIAAMEEAETYFLEGTPDELCREVVATRQEFDRSVAELIRTNAATVSESQGVVKIISRKILKAVNLTEYNRLKQRESRARKNVNAASNESSKEEDFKSFRDSANAEYIHTARESESGASDFGERRHVPPVLDNPCLDLNDFTYPLRDLVEAFPTINLTPANAGHIEAEVKPGDEIPWAETIKLYVRNHDPTHNRYLPEKVGNLLDVFKKKKQEYETKGNGINQQNHTNSGDRNANRINNTNAFIDRLRAEGAAEQALSGGSDGSG